MKQDYSKKTRGLTRMQIIDSSIKPPDESVASAVAYLEIKQEKIVKLTEIASSAF